MQEDIYPEEDFAPPPSTTVPRPRPSTQATRSQPVVPPLPPLARNPRQSPSGQQQEEPRVAARPRPSRRPGTGATGGQRAQFQQQQPPPPPQQDGPKVEQQVPPPPQQDTLHVPPSGMFALGWLGIAGGIATNILQVITSFVAFLVLFVTGRVYITMPASAQAKALPFIIAICGLMAVAFQLGVLYLAFRVQRTWKETKQSYGASVSDAGALREATIQIVRHTNFITVWGIISFIADGVGDYTFIFQYSDSWFLLLAYGLVMYAMSTIMLMEAMQFVWAGMVSYEWFKALKVQSQVMAAKLQRMKQQQGA